MEVQLRKFMTTSRPELDLASIERFLLERVETYEQLEALLWFARGTGEPRSAQEAAEALSLPELAVTDALNALAKAELLRRVAGAARFRYEPGTVELEAAVRKLSLLHEQDRIQVIRIMSAQSIARLRSSTLRAFAQHFRRRPTSR
jgi:hypothetical protein